MREASSEHEVKEAKEGRKRRKRREAREEEDVRSKARLGEALDLVAQEGHRKRPDDQAVLIAAVEELAGRSDVVPTQCFEAPGAEEEPADAPKAQSRFTRRRKQVKRRRKKKVAAVESVEATKRRSCG